MRAKCTLFASRDRGAGSPRNFAAVDRGKPCVKPRDAEFLKLRLHRNPARGAAVQIDVNSAIIRHRGLSDSAAAPPPVFASADGAAVLTRALHAPCCRTAHMR